ncbi:hypothetical protein [Agrobacterium bohemicum]|uniref:hypothetical protein n=1 Tax=Agrobacterium bohemicum TaxID=2052828 RepID=UPI000B166F93|nr:hypothetical protein [Agrobacterium bohemicum]
MMTASFTESCLLQRFSARGAEGIASIARPSIVRSLFRQFQGDSADKEFEDMACTR